MTDVTAEQFETALREAVERLPANPAPPVDVDGIPVSVSPSITDDVAVLALFGPPALYVRAPREGETLRDVVRAIRIVAKEPPPPWPERLPFGRLIAVDTIPPWLAFRMLRADPKPEPAP
jgi:hypothetical protein